jgi:hypothetical protein
MDFLHEFHELTRIESVKFMPDNSPAANFLQKQTKGTKLNSPSFSSLASVQIFRVVRVFRG